MACHDNGAAGGGGAGKTAYEQGDAALIALFCPNEPPPPEPICTDNDMDGFYAEGGSCGELDCNDNDATVYPGATEHCQDGVDNSCNGLVDSDDPDAQNCPLDCTDADGDGYSTVGGACGLVDCDDTNPDINPGAVEDCSDGVDNNCSGFVDTADENAVNCPIMCTDMDGDGYSTEGGECGPIDCDDNNENISPSAAEICDDDIDNNCNAIIDVAE